MSINENFKSNIINEKKICKKHGVLPVHHIILLKRFKIINGKKVSYLSKICAPCKKEGLKRYYESHRDIVIKKSKEWSKNNRDKINRKIREKRKEKNNINNINVENNTCEEDNILFYYGIK